MKNIETAIEKIKQEYNNDIPVRGGNGRSFADAIILDVFVTNNFVPIEYEIIKLIEKLIDRKLYVKEQYFINQNGKCYSILEIEETSANEEKFSTYIYFDTTDSWIMRY